MIRDVDVEYFLHCLFDGLNSGVAKFDYFSSIGHDDVVVLLVEVRFFIMRLILSKLVFANQTGFQQKLDRVVERGPAYAIVFVFHFDVEILYVKMLFAVINFLKDGVTLGRFAVSVRLKIECKNIFYNFLIATIIG